MNIDFTFQDGKGRDDKGNPIDVCRLFYKDTLIAKFIRKESDPSFEDLVIEHIKTYGYMAEHRRQWNKGNRVNWTEDMRVIV